MGAGFFQQLKILCYRNVLLKIRKARELSQEIITPIFFILILAILRLLVVPKTQPATGSFPSYPLLRSDFIVNSSQQILVSPNDNETVRFMDDVLQILQSTGKNLSYKTFFTSDELEDYYKKNSASVSSAVEIASLVESNVTLTIRMPFGTVPNENSANSQAGVDKCRKTTDGLSREECPANQFLYSGFASMQLATASVATKMLKAADFNLPEIQVEMLPKPAYEPSVVFLQIVSAIYYVVAFSPLLNFLTVLLVTEKEKKTRETMKIMGLRDSVFWLSWSAVYSVIIVIVSIAAVIITVAISFFQHSNLGLFFVLLVLYGLSIISLSFVFTPFFSKARTAGALASFSTVLISALYLVIPLTKDPTTGMSSIPPYGQWLLCLLSPLAFALAIDRSLLLDISGIGLTNDTVGMGEFPVSYSMIMLAVDTVLYALIAAYLDNVIPQEYGQQKVPYFFLLPSYWFPKEREVRMRQSDEDVNAGNDDVEPIPAELQDKKVIRIKNLYKRYRSKKGIVVAIPDLSLDIYEGQITCLLGHNGAGKTTLINMLTGMGEPTKGGATVYGLDISSAGDMSQLRQLFGMCPQQNVMFEDLTCEENLKVFANIKGVPPNRVDEEVNDVLEQVNLTEKKRAYAQKLSGGQKRKLCVAMALIGDPKVLFLDEPTSGLDPYSRRHLWSLLKSKRPGRVIVLTTHFMDEADILADRKAVINKGRLKCCGSSLFLKNRFGVGYHLDMVVEPSCDKGQITEVVRSKIPGAGEGRSHGQELSYTLPLDEAGKFSELFAVLGSPEGGPETEKLGIQSYGVSMTSLEEVFLKLEGKKIMREGEEEKKPDMSITNPVFDDLAANSEVSLNRIPVNGVNGMENGRSAANRDNMESIDTILSRTHIITEDRELLRHRFIALMKIRFLLAFRNFVAVYFRVFMPLMYIILGVVLVKVVNFGNSNPESKNADISPSMSTLPYINSTGHGVIDFVDRMASSGSFNAVEVASASDFNKFLPTWAMDIITLDIGTTGQVKNSNLTLFYNDTYTYSVPLSLWSALEAMFSSTNGTLSFYSRPLPPLTKTHVTDWGSFLLVQFLGMALSLIPSGFLVEAVRDRQCKAKSQLRVFGVGPSLYWGSMFMTDYLQYLFAVVVAVIAMAVAQLDSLQSGGAFLAIIILFLLYMPMNMILAYCISFMFDSHETALMAAPNILIMAGYLPFLPVSLLDSSNPDVSYYIHTAACIIDPPYIVFGGLHYIYRLYRYATQDLITGITDIPFSSYFEWSSNIPLPILMAALYIGPLILLMRYLDLRSTGGDPSDLFHCNKHVNSSIGPARNEDTILDEDEDIIAERKKIKQIEPSKPAIIVNGLRKEFTETGTSSNKCCNKEKSETTKLAVRNNSFTVMPGEVFGLLGPNGAGKTTTLNMVIAEVAPSCGEVTVGGYEVRSSLSKAFQMMGYCPQHDPLWETITLSEHLKCFAAIKGVALRDIHTIEDYFLKSLEIEEHKNKKAKELSGGTKRKLSYILSMLGDLKIVLLDEPSTGMDPKAKRFLWDTITASFTSERRGAILTTHYMEEADALCSRIAIMVNGEMKCIGSSTHLKNKYGSGYTLELKLRHGDHDLDTRHAEVEDQIRQLFQNAALSEKFGERAIYKVPRHSGLSLASAFIALEEMKRTMGVEEYSFSQATLEQVFLDFARKQAEEKEDAVEEKAHQNGNPSSQPSYRPIQQV